MPHRAPAPCRYCGALYCEAHRRGTAYQRGYTKAWAKYSREFRIQHPICMTCHEAPSEQTDHIIPVRGPMDPLFWEPTNHQALCTPCHSRKSAQDGGASNPPLHRDTTSMGEVGIAWIR